MLNPAAHAAKLYDTEVQACHQNCLSSNGHEPVKFNLHSQNAL